MARGEEVYLGKTLAGHDLEENIRGEVPIWEGLEPRCRFCLKVLLRRDKRGQDAEMALVGEKENLLGPLQENPCLEAPFLADVAQRRRVVDSPQYRRLTRRWREDPCQEDPQNTNLLH